MLSPLSRGYGTWTGNYDPYNEEGADSDSSFPEIEEPHRHGITVGFVSRTPSATPVSPPYRISSHHHNGREAALSGKRVSYGRDVSPIAQMSRENSDAQMNLPKTFLTRKGALMLFSAPEDEEESLTPSRSVGPRPRYMRLRKSADLIDTSLKLGTMDKLAMSVLQYGEKEIDKDKENTKVSDEKNQLFMKFLTKVDERDVDERAKPGGDVRYYLNDLKYKTSMQMGFTGDTSLPRSREALELRAILRGLQNNRWPVTYRQEGPDFRKPSNLAYEFSRPPSHLDHPPRNQYQRILSSRKLEDSVQSLRSCLGRSLDTVDEGPQPLLPKRHVKYKDDADSPRRNKYQQGMPDDDFGKRLRPHINTPAHVEGIVIKNAADEDEVEEEQYLDAKSSARDDGYYSVSQGDSCSFVLGPRNWTPVNSQAPKDEIVKPKVATVDVKKIVDRGSLDFDDDESSADEGLDGDGLVVHIADGSEESDVEIIYSNLGVPDNTLDTFEGYHSNNTSFQANSVKSISPDLTNQNTLVEGENSIVSKEIQSAITPQQIDLRKNSSENLNKMEEKDVNFASSSIKNVPHVKTDIVGTSRDDENYNNDPEFIASDGEDIDGLIEAENELRLISNKKESANRAISSETLHKRSMSRTPSSMHSTAHDDDQSSVTIIPHDQDLISVDVRSAKISQFVSNQNNAQAMEEDSQVTDNLAPTSEALTLVKDTESCVTGDDATSYAMSMGEDSSTVIQTLRDLHGDEEERRDQVGEKIDTRLYNLRAEYCQMLLERFERPRDDRVRNDIDNEDLNLHFTKTSTPFLPPTPTNESLSSARNNLSPVKDEPSNAKIQSREVTPDSTLKSVSSFVTADQSLNISQNNESKINRSSPDISLNNSIPSLPDDHGASVEHVTRQMSPKLEISKEKDNEKLSQKPESLKEEFIEPINKTSMDVHEHEKIDQIESKTESDKNQSDSQNLPRPKPAKKMFKKGHTAKKGDESGSEKSATVDEAVLVKGDNSNRTTPDITKLEDSAEIPLPATPRSTEITAEDKMSLHDVKHDVKSESASKLDEKEEVKEVDPKTLVSTQEDVTSGKEKTEMPTTSGREKTEMPTTSGREKTEMPTTSGREKTEMPTIPDFLKPKPQSKSQQRKDQKKKGQLQKGRRDSKTPPKDSKAPPKDSKAPPKDAKAPPTDAKAPPTDAKTPPEDVSKAMDITSVNPDEQEEEISQVTRKKVTLPPEKEHSIIPDFVSEAIQRSAERSKQQLEKEFKEQQELIGQEISGTLYEGEEGMTAEEFELAKKALKEKEETTKEKLVKGKQMTKKVEEKGRKSGSSSSGSIRSKKSKGPTIKDPLQQEKDRIKAVKEQEKRPVSSKRLEEIKLLEEKIQVSSNKMSAEDKKFKDKLQEVQMELERIEREAHLAEQTEADVRQTLKEDRMKRLEEKAKQKKEDLARRRMLMQERKLQERQFKEEARQKESQKIMMLIDDEERIKRQEQEKKKQEEEEKEEEKRRKEEEEELSRLDRDEEERRRQLEEEIEQDQFQRLQEEQDEIRKQQEAILAQKEALLEEQRRKRELLALEEQKQQEELDRIQREEMKKLEDERARMQELQRLEEEVRENMRLEMEQRKESAIQRREYNIESKSNLNRIRHSQGMTRPWVWSYFIQWPMETYMRPVGEQEKMKKEAKLRAKRKKAR